jgi:penicillin amidase
VTPAGALPPRRRRWPIVLGGAAAVVALSIGGAGLWLDSRLRASLPPLAGERPLAGLVAEVRVERDARGVPFVRGRSRADVARALGFVHAQDRFFQMDLLRRRSAGELAELVGDAALPADREVRVFRMRAVARRAVEALPAGERALLQAYTEGVAAGLASLEAPPFEYLVLSAEPAPWRPEDSMLCALTMFLTLQDELPAQESTLGVMDDVLPEPLFEFLAPKGTEWDASLQGAPFVQPSLPGPEVVDLRATSPTAVPAADAAAPGRREEAGRDPLGPPPAEEPFVRGSNNWAVAGARTAHGGAILANDMHLGISVPNTWYRASLAYDSAGAARRVTGVTLPGAPFVVAGSNGRIAWGFTNSEGDWADLVVVEPVEGDPASYRTQQGPRKLERVTETIRMKGGGGEVLEVQETAWGPVVDVDHAGRRRALAWVALREGGLNAALIRLEDAASVAEALALAPEVGIPNQNLVVGDADGHVGWTIIGRIPRRFGHDGRLPASWADGTRGWDGWLPAAEYPRVVDPPSGRVFSANARVADGAALDKVGFGGYDLGARQRQIRDGLLAIEKATEADMLKVQLDDRALLLDRWQKLLLSVLAPEAAARTKARAEARRLVEAWGGRASVDSAGYRIVRAFRLRVAEDVTGPLLAACRRADPGFQYLGGHGLPGHRQWEGPVWALVSHRPAHLLDPRFRSWDELLLSALDAVVADLTEDGVPLASRTWGERNTTLIQHPLSRAVPPLARLLDMPRQPLPGDSHMPRFQSPGGGASERLAVSPGREAEGYFHMPTGQSGHPRSPHYADGHAAWASGEPTPFLPGPAVNVLTLKPAP